MINQIFTEDIFWVYIYNLQSKNCNSPLWKYENVQGFWDFQRCIMNFCEKGRNFLLSL